MQAKYLPSADITSFKNKTTCDPGLIKIWHIESRKALSASTFEGKLILHITTYYMCFVFNGRLGIKGIE